MTKHKVFASLLFCLAIFYQSFSQELELTSSAPMDNTQKMEQSIFDWFHRDTILQIQIETDLQRFFDNKSIDGYQPALLRFQDLNDRACVWPIEIKARGKSRRQFCDLPPLKIRFFAQQLDAQNLADCNSLKMVTHCRESVDIRNTVVKEYVVYQLLNLLTPNSFRVQLLEIEYLDAQKRKAPIREYAMMLEPEDQLAKRLDGTVMQQRGALSKYVSKEELTFMALFQYMIGNTDWILDRQHNVKFVKCEATKQLKAIAYDFDVCGLVDAAYAMPASHLPIESVQDRLFLGNCVTEEFFRKTLSIFQKHKTEMIDFVENFEWLPRNHRKQMTHFIYSFYKAMERPDFIEKELLDNCKK